MTKSALILSGLTGAASAEDAGIHKKTRLCSNSTNNIIWWNERNYENS